MDAPSSIDPARVLHDHLARASPHLMRELLGTLINAFLSADADAGSCRGVGTGGQYSAGHGQAN